MEIKKWKEVYGELITAHLPPDVPGFEVTYQRGQYSHGLEKVLCEYGKMAGWFNQYHDEPNEHRFFYSHIGAETARDLLATPAAKYRVGLSLERDVQDELIHTCSLVKNEMIHEKSTEGGFKTSALWIYGGLHTLCGDAGCDMNLWTHQTQLSVVIPFEGIPLQYEITRSSILSNVHTASLKRMVEKKLATVK